jgi:hypothetical protein
MALIYYMSQELRGIVVKRFRKGFEFAWLFSLRQKRILNYLVISLELPLLVVSTVAAPARALYDCGNLHVSRSGLEHQHSR